MRRSFLILTFSLLSSVAMAGAGDHGGTPTYADSSAAVAADHAASGRAYAKQPDTATTPATPTPGADASSTTFEVSRDQIPGIVDMVEQMQAPSGLRTPQAAADNQPVL